MFEAIEKLKQEYTDKYVVADASIPELARFQGQVGQVKTVNMNGRALVEFDCWSNIGWYDIELDYLKVVPKPEPEAKTEKPAKAPAKPPAKAAAAAPGGKKLSPLEMARMQGAAKGAAAPSAEKKAPAPAAKAKMSTADVLAAARAKKSSEAAGEPAAQASAPTAPAVNVEQAEPQQEPASPEPQEAADKGAAPAFTKGQRPSVAEILAWCREHDAK